MKSNGSGCGSAGKIRGKNKNDVLHLLAVRLHLRKTGVREAETKVRGAVSQQGTKQN